QQDAFRPYVETCTIVLIGATTENPSFEANGALLSRARVYVLRPLGETDLVAIREPPLRDAGRGRGGLGATVEPEALALIARLSDGAARTALNVLELAVTGPGARVTETAVRDG